MFVHRLVLRHVVLCAPISDELARPVSGRRHICWGRVCTAMVLSGAIFTKGGMRPIRWLQVAVNFDLIHVRGLRAYRCPAAGYIRISTRPLGHRRAFVVLYIVIATRAVILRAGHWLRRSAISTGLDNCSFENEVAPELTPIELIITLVLLSRFR